MNKIPLNIAGLDGGVIIKKGGGGGVTINNQEKSLEITENGVTEVTADSGFTGLSKVIVNTNVQSGGGGTTKGINFYDYDGTLLHSFSTAETKAMSELPVLPERQGLVCQGWNCELDYIKHMANEYGRCDIGAIYITDDEMTRMYVVIDEFATNTISMSFTKSSGSGVLSIDWGDGSPVETMTSYSSYTKAHVYKEYGNYCISIGGNTFINFSLEQRSKTAVTKVEMGRYPSDVDFNSCPLLETISLSQHVTSIKLKDCRSLVACMMPNGVNETSSSFENCDSLRTVSIPQGLKTAYTTFQYCSALTSVVLPEGFNNSRGSNFRFCYELKEVVIPESFTAIGQNEFAECRNLRKVDLHANVTSIGGNAFNKCYALEEIVIPDGVVSLSESSVFQEDKALRKIILPDTMTTLGYYCFGGLSSLMHITLPKSLVSVDRYCFSGGPALSYDFSRCEVVPSLGISGIYNPLSDYAIIVPDALYDEWIAATNWSSLASKIIKKSDWDASQS